MVVSYLGSVSCSTEEWAQTLLGRAIAQLKDQQRVLVAMQVSFHLERQWSWIFSVVSEENQGSETVDSLRLLPGDRGRVGLDES